MKKILSILIAIFILISVVPCLSVGAVSDSTADEANTGIDLDVDLQVKKDANEYFFDGKQNIDDIIITYFGTLSDGSLVLNVDKEGSGYPDVYFEDIIGDYYYSYNAGDEAYVYRNNTFCFVEKAYDIGLIDDNTLSELSKISKEYLKHPYNYCSFNFRPIIGESGLDSNVESEIKTDAYGILFGEPFDPSNIVVTYFGTLSDGSMVVNVDHRDAGHVEMVSTEILGDYCYVMYNSGQGAYIYKDHQFYFIVDAYNDGMIDDDVLDELYACSVEYSKNPKNDKSFVLYPLSAVSTEPTTQPQTTNVEETKATNSTDLKSSTSDTPKTKTSATADTITIKNSNGTVQTGQNNFTVVLTLMFVMLAAATAIFIKCRYHD